ncbi:MAG: hypothetical protein K1X78_02020 [Verrucomicrobiaceae bacterium]|nr:hypothetical protein [Verrucomicrobiaceae bacterium]
MSTKRARPGTRQASSAGSRTKKVEATISDVVTKRRSGPASSSEVEAAAVMGKTISMDQFLSKIGWKK